MKIRSQEIALFLYRATAFCVGISLAFFLFAQVVASIRGEGQLGISFSQYALILLFSLLLSAAHYLFCLPLARPLCIFIHYAVCAVAFYIVFFTASKLMVENAGAFIVLLGLFTLFYIIFFGAAVLLRFLVSPKRKQKKAAEANAEASYERRF